MADASVLNGLLDAQLTAERLAKQAHQEFADIENMCVPFVPTLNATAHRNQKKNRYCDVLPFDNNIVELPSIPHRVKHGSQPDHNSYINGSWIRDVHVCGANAPHEMVVTQGPLPETVPEFWRLVALLPAPRAIVMLTNMVENNVDKCCNYLHPNQHMSPKFQGRRFEGTVEVHEEKEINQDITWRLLELRLGGKKAQVMRVDHFHYHRWPDHGIPDSTAPLRELADRMCPTEVLPLVHCSAGIGRTGCFAVLLLTMRRLRRLLEQQPDAGWSKAVQVGETVRMLRQQRGGMVQTPQQLMFCYQAVLDGLKHEVAACTTRLYQVPSPTTGVFIDGTCRSVQASPQQSGAAPQTPLTSPAAFTDRVGPTVSQERRVVDLHGSSVAGRGAPGLPPTQGRPYMPVQPPSLPTPAVTEDVRITAKVKACAKAGSRPLPTLMGAGKPTLRRSSQGR